MVKQCWFELEIRENQTRTSFYVVSPYLWANRVRLVINGPTSLGAENAIGVFDNRFISYVSN